MSTGYKVNGVDLDDIFEPIGVGQSPAGSDYYTNSQNLIGRYWLLSYGGSPIGYNTGYKIYMGSDGNPDLSNLFAAKGSIVVPVDFEPMVNAYGEISAGLTHLGTVVFSGGRSSTLADVDNWTDIKSIGVSEIHIVGLKHDGTVLSTSHQTDFKNTIESWTNIKSLHCGEYNVIGIRNDGGFEIASQYGDSEGELNIGGWTDIVDMDLGRYHTVGVKSDGTVVGTGLNHLGQINVGSWSNVVKVSCQWYSTIGLRSDGTAIYTGENSSTYNPIVATWTDLIDVKAGSYHVLGLKSDGTVVVAGTWPTSYGDVQNWKGVVQIASGGAHIIGLKVDGTVLATGYNFDGIGGSVSTPPSWILHSRIFENWATWNGSSGHFTPYFVWVSVLGTTGIVRSQATVGGSSKYLEMFATTNNATNNVSVNGNVMHPGNYLVRYERHYGGTGGFTVTLTQTNQTPVQQFVPGDSKLVYTHLFENLQPGNYIGIELGFDEEGGDSWMLVSIEKIS